jgi:predicted RNase H-like HicB family nuclease
MTRYAILIERASDGFAAYVPDLPGCVAVGDTEEEVIQAIRKAIVWHLEGMREDGVPIAEPRTVTATMIEVEDPALSVSP